MIQKATPMSLHAIANATQMTANGSAVNISNAHEVVIVAEFSKGDGAALTLQPQAQDSVTNAWANITNNVRIWVAADTSVSDTLVRATNATVFNTGAVATAHRVVMQLNPDSIGLSAAGNPRNQIRVVIAGGNAADRGSVTAYLTPIRYKP